MASNDFTYYCTAGTPEHQKLEQPDANFPPHGLVAGAGLDPEVCIEHQPLTPSEATDAAIAWQDWAAGRDLSYGELAEVQSYFERLAARWPELVDEFKENAII